MQSFTHKNLVACLGRVQTTRCKTVASLFIDSISIGVFIHRAVEPRGSKQATAVEITLLNKLATGLQRLVCTRPYNRYRRQ